MTEEIWRTAPGGLHPWFMKWLENTSDELIYKSAAKAQIMFVRDDLNHLVTAGLRTPNLPYGEQSQLEAELIHGTPKVIGEHYSKSVCLPVYSLERADLGIRFILRCNFYNWKLSVISVKPIEVDWTGLFFTTPPVEPDYTGDPLHSVYFEGFPKEFIFGYYEQNKCRWSAEIHGDQAMWTVIFLIMRSLGAIKPLIWSTRSKT